jgi:hypothetical protein
MFKHLVFTALMVTGISCAAMAAPLSDDSSIGTATMQADGTIVVTLRAEDDNGAMGDSKTTYPPSDKEYNQILAHIGSLKPGETKPVPPWPEIE